jgi:hypothetical protein
LNELDQFINSQKKPLEDSEIVQKKLVVSSSQEIDRELLLVENQFENNFKKNHLEMIDNSLLEDSQNYNRFEFNSGNNSFGQGFSNIVSFGVKDNNNNNIINHNLDSFGAKENDDDQLSDNKHLIFSEEELKKKLQSFDRNKLICPKLFPTDQKISDEILSKTLKKKNPNPLTISFSKNSNSLPWKIQSEDNQNLFDREDSNEGGLMYTDTAEFKPNSFQKKAKVFNDFEIELENSQEEPGTNRDLSFGANRNYSPFKRVGSFDIEQENLEDSEENLQEDFRMRNTMIGRQRRTNHNNGRSTFKTNNTNLSKNKRVEVIIEQINESGVMDPSINNPELKEPIQQFESEYNSLPDDI